jgi:DNA polymerase (family 10)
MSVHNADIARVFGQIADLLEIEGANPFRVRAYRNAARELEMLGVPAADMLARGEDLRELPGIGDDLAAKIAEIVATGSCKALEKLRHELPPTITQLLEIPRLGPKRVRALYEQLGVRTLEQLAEAARSGRIRALEGFGPKTEEAILQALAVHATTPARMERAIAAQYAEPLRELLARVAGVQQAVIAGSFRRARETVGDIDILVSASAAAPVMERFVHYDEVTEVLAHGETRATAKLGCGLQVDLRVVEPESHGAALLYFTGSKAHNIALRRIAQSRALKLSEYGLFRGNRRTAGATEESVYRALGLPWIAPELRENRGEIEAARAGRLPPLIERRDLRGDLHVHTRASDGHDTLRAMAEAARAAGLEYIAITEHSRRLAVAHGLDPERLRRQMTEIDALNAELVGITVLKGIEVDILEDGRLDLPDEVLADCDLVVGAVHSAFELPRAKQTRRILRALENPNLSILAHPTNRVIGARAACDIDMLRVVRQARASGCFLELNAQPGRLDLLDTHCRLARDEGVLVAIGSDAHGVRDYANLDWGIGQARRGWLGAGDVLNTRPLAQLRKLLARRRR